MTRSYASVSVLVVDDDRDHRYLIERVLTPVGHEVRFAASGQEALEKLGGVDLVLLDQRLPDTSGIDLLPAIEARNGPSVIMVTSSGSESLAVEAMRRGAVDYVVKEADYLARLPQVIQRAWQTHDLGRRARQLQRLALLVHSAEELPRVYEEIVAGARELLRARSAGLFVVNESGTVEMLAGDAEGASAVAARVAALLTPRAADAPRSRVDDRLLIVALPGAADGRLGALAVWESSPRAFVDEEASLAETFAAFAGTALANAERLELERSLVGRLQDMLDLRRSLVMSLSHELRTPLTCVVGFAETLLGNWDRLDERARFDCVNAIRDNATELRSLVEQLLDFGALEAGRLVATPADLDLAEELERTLQSLAPLLGDRPVSCEVPHLDVSADPVLLRRTMANLLSNAAKYAGPGAAVSVRALEEGDAVRVEVADQGIGMTAEEANRVFEPFWRSSGAQLNATRGSGIGLSLVREYVRLMGGNVAVRSAPGQGSCFSFTLPRAQAPDQP